ncbi:MAG: riboflavin biosynthesis protein RibF [Planctomycetota bacterium]
MQPCLVAYFIDMKISNLKEISPAHFTRPVVAIGVFDGFHTGHQKIIRELVEWAKKIKGESVILTFKRHPRQVLVYRRRKKKNDCLKIPPFSIITFRHRLLFFERFGINHCVILPFTKKFADTPAEKFVTDVLIKKIHTAGILMGFDSSFGRNCEGNTKTLRSIVSKHNIELRICSKVKTGKETASSTLVRKLISTGKIKKASSMLGRDVSIIGVVVKGDGRGNKIGFPTANLDLHHETRPPAGVYTGKAEISPFNVKNPKLYPAMINIGARPTFRGKKEMVEVHLIGFSGDLYGKELDVSFTKKLRDECRFNSAEALIKQLSKDKKNTLILFNRRK